jgi:hypothetical protein
VQAERQFRKVKGYDNYRAGETFLCTIIQNSWLRKRAIDPVRVRPPETAQRRASAGYMM